MSYDWDEWVNNPETKKWVKDPALWKSLQLQIMEWNDKAALAYKNKDKKEWRRCLSECNKLCAELAKLKQPRPKATILSTLPWYKPYEVPEEEKEFHAKMDLLCKQRAEARKRKDWETADKIREEMKKNGVRPEDRVDGTTYWRCL